MYQGFLLAGFLVVVDVMLTLGLGVTLMMVEIVVVPKELVAIVVVVVVVVGVAVFKPALVTAVVAVERGGLPFLEGETNPDFVVVGLVVVVVAAVELGVLAFLEVETIPLTDLKITIKFQFNLNKVQYIFALYFC